MAESRNVQQRQKLLELTSAMENTINFALIQQLRVLGLDRLQLDSHLFSGGHISAQVDIAKRPASNLPPQAVLLPHSQLHGFTLLN